MSARAVRPDNPKPVAGDDSMTEQIEKLLEAPTCGDAAPSLARMEDTLTEGYAQALALEAERWRLERRLGEVARAAEDGDGLSFADELSSLGKRLRSADGELTKLRSLLGTLQA